MSKYIAAIICFTILITKSYAFTSDVCFTKPRFKGPSIKNCIGVEEFCRTSNLTSLPEIFCKTDSLSSAIFGLTKMNSLVGGRSLVHGDATYLMAQLIGFTPWQAYETMMFNSAADQSTYTPFDQFGRQILSNDVIKSCRKNWGPKMPNHCLLTIPVLNGINKLDYKTGGMYLHWHALYAANSKPIPQRNYPTDYLSVKNSPYETILTNFKAWLYKKRTNACTAGITENMSSISSPCVSTNNILYSPMNLFSADISLLRIPFKTKLGPLIISNTNKKIIFANDKSLQNYIYPEDVNYAKLGIFLHMVADRYSHHLCIDNSYFFKETNNTYNSKYSAPQCSQGKHILRHVWEQGTNQSNKNLKPKFQTIKPALESVYDQLIEYANYSGIKVNYSINKEMLINRLIQVIQIEDPKIRLDKMVKLTDSYHLTPLPGHGSMANISIDDWLKIAKAPIH